MNYSQHKQEIERIVAAWRAGTRIVEVREAGKLVKVRRVCAECGE